MTINNTKNKLMADKKISSINLNNKTSKTTKKPASKDNAMWPKMVKGLSELINKVKNLKYSDLSEQVKKTLEKEVSSTNKSLEKLTEIFNSDKVSEKNVKLKPLKTKENVKAKASPAKKRNVKPVTKINKVKKTDTNTKSKAKTA